jgi:uridine kinase
MKTNVYVVAIAGPSCAGKTQLAQRLARELRGSVLPLDSYYRDLSSMTPAERGRVNFDAPFALDHELLIRHVRALSRGEAVRRPVYDFATHTRLAHFESFCANEYLILEGLFALYWPELRELSDTRVFVDAPDKVCLGRRQLRDVSERGRTADSVLSQFTETVRPMAEQYVRPTSKYADVILSGDQLLSSSVDAVLELVYRNRAHGFAASAREGSRQDYRFELHR